MTHARTGPDAQVILEGEARDRRHAHPTSVQEGNSTQGRIPAPVMGRTDDEGPAQVREATDDSSHRDRGGARLRSRCSLETDTEGVT